MQRVKPDPVPLGGAIFVFGGDSPAETRALSGRIGYQAFGDHWEDFSGVCA